MIVGVALEHHVVELVVAFNLGDVAALVGNDGRSVQVHLVVDNEQRVVGVHHVVVNRHTVQVLFKQVLEEEVFLLESSLLLLDGQFVEVHLVDALVEVVQHFELLKCFFLVQARDFFDVNIGLVHGVGVGLVERQDLFFLGFKFATQLRGLQNLLA